MLRWFTTLSLLCLTLLVCATVVVSARPAQPPLLPDGLAVENCSPPCFLGIRPGVTTQAEALELLQKNDWIGELMWHKNRPGDAEINWKWNDRAPAAFRPPDSPEGSGQITIVRSTVIDIQVMATVSAGDLWLNWGEPAIYGMALTSLAFGAAPRLGFTMLYPDRDFWFAATIHCPYYPQMWDNEVSILHWTDLEHFAPYILDDRSQQQFGRQVVARNQAECRF